MAGKKAAKKEKEVVVLSNDEQFEQQLASNGLAGALRIADEYDTSNYVCISTGFQVINQIINAANKRLQGLPISSHSEWFSLEEHVGKTSIVLAIGQYWQSIGKKVAIIDIEPSIKTNYLRQLGYITSKEEAAAKGLYAVRLLQPRTTFDESAVAEELDIDMVYAERVLDTIAIAVKLFDLVIVDSVDAMVSEAEADKNSDEADRVGGPAKLIKSWFRKHGSTARAHTMWVNHGSMTIGRFPKLVTTGGKAVPRYSTLRFRIDRVEMLKENTDADPYGFISKVTTVKNRLDIIGKSAAINYISGEGFSKDWDYYKTAQKLKIITKNGAWMYYGTKDDNKARGQGELNFYRFLRNEAADLFDEIKRLIDGENVEPEITDADASLLEGIDVIDQEVQEAA